MQCLKQIEVIWRLLSSKRGLWPVFHFGCNLCGALCYLISFCCLSLLLSVCVPLAYVFPAYNSNQNSLTLHMYEAHKREWEDCRLLLMLGHGDIISVQGQTHPLIILDPSLQDWNGPYEFVSDETPDLH